MVQQIQEEEQTLRHEVLVVVWKHAYIVMLNKQAAAAFHLSIPMKKLSNIKSFYNKFYTIQVIEIKFEINNIDPHK